MGSRRLALLLLPALTGNASAEQVPASRTDAVVVATAVVSQQEVDPVTGLIKAENWELVRSNCTVCHSARLIIQQRASRTGWTDMIRWMQATQSLWQFDGPTEEKILDYLAANYPPSQTTRRLPIPVRLRPLNPYSPVHRIDETETASPRSRGLPKKTPKTIQDSG